MSLRNGWPSYEIVPTTLQDAADSFRRLLLPLEYFSEGNFEDVRDAERRFEGGGVFSNLDCGDRLPCDADALSQLGLGHFAIVETEGTDLVSDFPFHHACLR